MAYRAVLSKFMQNANMVKPILARPAPMIVTRVQPQSSLKPLSTIDRPSIFSLTMIKKYWEISPILIIISATIFAQVIWIVRHALTRDDVRYSSNDDMACLDNDVAVDAPPVRKFVVYNQKYEISPELHAALEALKPPTEEEKAAH